MAELPFVSASRMPPSLSFHQLLAILSIQVQMLRPFICEQGENVSKKEPVRKSYYLTYQNDFGGSFSVTMLQCDDKVAPVRKTKSVIRLCKIDCTIDVPFSQLDDGVNQKTGKKIKKLNFDLEMVPSGASVEFVVYVNGKRQGSQNAAISFQ